MKFYANIWQQVFNSYALCNFLLVFSSRRILVNPYEVTILTRPGLSYTLEAFLGE